jgi:hypothetical protein
MDREHMKNCWKVFCEDSKFPGLWPRWFKNQCAAVSWNPNDGWTMEGKARKPDWTMARKYLARIEPGDMLVVQLKENRVGRVGEVVRKEVDDDQWNPTVPPSKERPSGRLGRRIAVRWDLTTGPTDADTVVLLPKFSRLPMHVARPTICPLDWKIFNGITKAMQDKANWVGLQDRFDYERSLSDYIATYPHRVEDDLMPYPDAKVRENAFPDKSRSDVLLIDRDGIPVVVECKQGAPTLENINQLREYMKHVQKLTRKKQTRGILVHGGAANLKADVMREVTHDRSLRVVRYSLNVDFVSSS